MFSALTPNRKEENANMGIHEALQQRICEPIEITGAPEYIISVLLAKNALFPRDERRRLPYTGLLIAAKTKERTQFSLKEARALSEVVTELCSQHGLCLTTDGDAIVIMPQHAHKA